MLFSVYDTETTGLTKHPDVAFSQQPRVIEFAGIITDGERVISKLEFICNPHEPLEPIITKITGFTDEMLADKPPFSAFRQELAAHFKQAQCVIAHNLSFDKDMINAEAQRLDMSLSDFNWPPIEVCTVEQLFHRFGRRMKLSELYELAFGNYTQKHRAMDDLLLLHSVAIEYGIYDAVKQAYA